MKEDKSRRILIARAFVVYVAMMLFGVAIIVRAGWIQVVEGPELRARADSLTLKYFEIEASRGNIFSDDGSLLATSVPIFDIRMDVASPLISDDLFTEQLSPLAAGLSDIFKDRTAWEYKTALRKARRNGNRYFLIKKNVTYEQLKKVRELPILERGKFRGGLIIIPKTRRQKPFGLLAQRTIGYENERENLFVGLEGAYNEVLKGHNGQQLRRRVNNGAWIPVFGQDEIEPENGKDIVSTIDVNLQDVAESSLYQHLIEHQADWGCAILMEVSTGNIKAIANLALDPKTGKYTESYNYAVGHGIEPGSTFKLPSMITLFEEGLSNLDDTIDIGPGWKVYHGLTIKDVHAIRDGRVSIREVFEKSSNVGVSMLVTDHFGKDPQRYIDHLYDMSLNEPLNLEIPGEPRPVIKRTSDRSWSAVSLPFMSIGYELKLTPLQILSFYNAVANDGTLMKPRFISEIREGGKVIEQFKPEVLNKKICSDNSIALAHEILEGVVLRGTATSLKKSPYSVAGKTGTAQIASGTSGYNKRNYNASFVGYFPADNPRYSCIVVVSNPSTGRYYATSVAVPVFKDIADKVYASHIEIQAPDTTRPPVDYPLYATGFQPELKELLKTFHLPLADDISPADWAVTVLDDSVLNLKPRIPSQNLVPNVKGMGARDAVYLLEQLGLNVRLNGRGIVKEQSIKPGTRIVKGGTIYLRLDV
ncbi:MAG: penicillin-binding protein [Bacteroidales bacterium]